MVIQQNKIAIDFPMQREVYLSSWKTFRAISDENVVTAKHILSLPTWKDGVPILDLGCGDGLILQSLITQAGAPVPEVMLIDPDKEMLLEARQHIKETHLVSTITIDQALFESVLPLYISSAEMVLAIHIVYLIKPETFLFLLQSLRPGQTLFVVLDNDDSIFSELWNVTARKYVERSQNVRRVLETPMPGYSVRKSIIRSTLVNPLSQLPDVQNGLLSLLSYADIKKLPVEAANTVKQIVAKYVEHGEVVCTSACYEIRTKKQTV
jgi:SAM-dependent methyltransferase